MARGTLRIRVVGDASNLQKTLGNATGSIGKFARRGLLAMGAAAVTGAALSVRAFANFDQAMTNSTAIMGEVSNEMRGNMADAAREVAKTTQFSATEAAESYFFLASAGMDAAASIEALPRVAAFAQAGQFDMARATDLLTDAQSALGLAVDDTAENIENLSRVSDVLVAANTLANASVEEFSEALTNKAGAALRNLNMDIEEGVAVLAVYADQGRKGSEAGTMLNATLEGLTRTARLNAEAYEDLGVAVFDSEGEMRNMADIVGDLEGALGGMTTEQQLAEIAALGLTRQARDGVIALLDSSEAIRGYESDLRDAGGTTQDVADNQMDTFWAQLGLVKDQIIDVGLSIGEALMPALRGFVDWLQGNLPAITEWFSDVAGKFTELLGVADESMNGAIEVAGDFASGWREVSGDVQASVNDMERETGTSVGAMNQQVQTAFNDMERETGQVLSDWSHNVAQGTGDVSDSFDEAGTFMDRMWQAWLAIWEEDIKPWLLNTVVPWFRDVFGPAVGDALASAGRSAAGRFIQAIRDQLNFSGIRDLAGFTPGGALGRFLSGGSSGSTLPGPGDRFDAGGEVGGRKGAPRLILAHGGETVLPTHKPGFDLATSHLLDGLVKGGDGASAGRRSLPSRAGGSLPPKVEVAVYLGDRELGSAVVDAVSAEVSRRDRWTAGASL